MAAGSGQESPYPRTVGVLGAGFLAVPLTRRLREALPPSTAVSVFSRKPDVLSRQLALGARRAASAADLAARCEVVFFLLGDADQIETQLTGPSGFEAGVHSPTIAVITTALPPERLRSLAHRITDRTAGRLRLVDAPLSGPRSALLRGRLAVAVGAASSTFPEIEPLLAVLGPVLRVGGLGAAQVAHACEQLVVAATAAGLAEAILVAERSGLDVDGLLATWRTTGATTSVVEAALDQRRSRDAEPEQPTAVLAGPLTVAAGEVSRIGVPARLLVELRDLAGRLERSGLGPEDLSAGYRALAAEAGPPVPGRTGSGTGTGAD